MSCGRNENEEDNSPLPPVVKASSVCVRCASPPVIVVRTTSYCHDCFMIVFPGRFFKNMDVARSHSRFGGSKAIKLNEKRGDKRSSVLVAFSGGPASRVLLRLMKTYLLEAETIKAKFNGRYAPPPTFSSIEVVYVDESSLPGYGGVDRTEEIRAIVESEGFTFVRRKLEDVFSPSSPSLSVDVTSPDLRSHFLPASSTSPLDSLLSLFSSFTPTSLTSLHASLLQSLLRRTALERSHSILITGETATRVAIKTLSGMAEGRGWGMGEEVGLNWELETGPGKESLLMVRPLGLSLAKEIVYYVNMEKLESVTSVKPGTGKEARSAGIEALTEEFVLGLEASFPATVSTIIRTAGKLGMRTADARERGAKAESCPLCGLPAQAGAKEWRTAITISSLTEPSSLTLGMAPPAIATGLSPSDAELIPLAPLLCYGCLLIYQDLQSPLKADPNQDRHTQLNLPTYVAEDATRERENRLLAAIEQREDDERDLIGIRVKGVEELRNEVASFLL